MSANNGSQSIAPTLAVVAISHNEERDLPGFLENVLPWVDEVVLVDDNSTDKTREIARGAGEKVKLIESPRREGEYFADQRNKGIDCASSDWLLHMDIDERVPPALAAEIRKAISSKNFDAYRFRRRNYFLHRPMKGGGWADWNQVHLARRELLRFGGMFHESCNLAAPDNRIGQLGESMLHLNDESYAERLRKSGRYQEEVTHRIRSRRRQLCSFDVCWSFIREFLLKYFWKRGFMDGTPGLIWALHSASAAFRATALVWDEQHRIARESLEEELRWQGRTTDMAKRSRPIPV